MTVFDDTPSDSPPLESFASPEEPLSVEPSRLRSTAIRSRMRSAPQAVPMPICPPEDLRISWSWPHFVLFFFFTTPVSWWFKPRCSSTTVPATSPQEELERYLLNKPQFIFGTNLLWYAAVFLFLYVTLSVLRDSPFWSSLGWKKLKSTPPNLGRTVVLFLRWLRPGHFRGGGQLAGAHQGKPAYPGAFQEPQNALLLMSMAVLVAPLVEETVFRGYLYPLFARFTYNVTRHFGMVPAHWSTSHPDQHLVDRYSLWVDARRPVRWTWAIVTLLIVVGIVFTSVRARTGTVFASFLLHLGYNSMIAVTTIIGTHGFTRIPTAP